MRVTLVEMRPRCLSLAFDDQLCGVVEGLLRAKGITIKTGSMVREFVGSGSVQGVSLGDGGILEADAVLIASGVIAETRLARRVGLPLGPRGGIRVDSQMRTSDEYIFACGDCAEKVSFFDGSESSIKLASVAAAEARIAAANLYETCCSNPGAIGVYSTVVNCTAFASAGLTEDAALEAGFSIAAEVAEAPNRHPAGMPGSAQLRMKLIFDSRTGQILWGQCSGAQSAGEIVNALAVCIQKHMTAAEIATMQLGTHPALTASPVLYPLLNAAESVAGKLRNGRR